MTKKPLIIAAAVLYASTINAQNSTPSCERPAFLFAKQTLIADTENLKAIAEKSTKAADGSYLLSGDASLKSSQYYLAADEISIDPTNKLSAATGDVRFQSNGLMLTAQSATIDQKLKTPNVALEKAHFQYLDSKISGTAQSVSSFAGQQIFDAGSYTLCPTDKIDWQIKADKITLDTESNLGTAEDATLEFLGLPIFYIPQYQWTLKGRSSGFLTPNISTYTDSGANQKSGFGLKIPYYFNLAPDRDFLLTLNRLSTRGSVVEGLYRQLITKNNSTPLGQLDIEGHYLDEDAISKDKRWLLKSKLDLTIDEKTTINIDTNRVSDAQYFTDIANDNTSISSLNSKLDVNYQNAHGLQLSLLTEAQQLVNDGTASYTRAPEVSVSKRIQGLGGRSIDLSLTNAKFKHLDDTKITGDRTHIQAHFKREISTDVYALSPQLKFSTTQYNLDNNPNQQRTLTQFRLDSKWFLERDQDFFNTNIVQTLTPRLTYNYTPLKNQSALPSFDSEEKNFSYESLFSAQNYTGIDRINAANDFTLGLESDFIDEENGDTYLSLKIAQAFYLGDRDINAAGNLVSRKKYSDIAAAVDFAVNNMSFNNAVRYDTAINKITERDSSISYLWSSRKFLTLAHHNDNKIESAELYGAYPINKEIHIFAGINRSLTDNVSNKETSGIAYESCCYTLRLAHFKTHLSDGNYEYVTSLELALKGLASTSSGLGGRLEENIPHYLSNFEND